MKKTLVFLAFLGITASVRATPAPMKGGYLGHKIIICAEGSYMPNYSRLADIFMSYNMQYGGNLHFISGRYSEIGLSYNMYSLHAHHRYEEDLSNSGTIKGFQVGITYRKYREGRGRSEEHTS